MGKGSKRRPTVVSDKQFEDNWEKVFGKKEPKVKSRKVTPKHGQSQVHKDKTKYKRKDKFLHLTMKALGVKIWG